MTILITWVIPGDTTEQIVVLMEPMTAATIMFLDQKVPYVFHRKLPIWCINHARTMESLKTLVHGSIVKQMTLPSLSH